MTLCSTCLHAGVCTIKQKLEEDTVLKFPDGKSALVDMESALVSCDHHVVSFTNKETSAESLGDCLEKREDISGLEGRGTDSSEKGFVPLSGAANSKQLQVSGHAASESWTFGPGGSVEHTVGEPPIIGGKFSTKEVRRIRLSLGQVGRRK